ncbi:MAG: UDP-N-acetylmuramate--L-alanine ligase [Candidatus Omnitrophica bacterium]|nr:UDP-N-acetylmuramate--L-alanine ligase [Candidatus Omnitrophota bacterium]
MNYHFIGIGGIGMSALAHVLLAKGNRISGSDLRSNNLTEHLARKGAVIKKGHSPLNIPGDARIVVRSTSIPNDNPEMIKAEEMSLEIISRSELLRRVMSLAKISVGVTGTHGKTTTSALIAHILWKCERQPTVLVGGEIESIGGNALLGDDDLIVAEVDESDGFFRDIRATNVCVTNVEREHMEHYGSMENLKLGYRKFFGNMPREGVLLYNADDKLLKELVADAPSRKVPFSFAKTSASRYYSKDAEHARSIKFKFCANGKIRGDVMSTLIGRHNVMNLISAVGMCLELGLSFEEVVEAVLSFRTVKRRFYPVGEARGVKVYEDYAHHPTELRAVITAARDFSPDGKLIVVFQPHRYSRTIDLKDEFAGCFKGADILILTDIYSADESDSFKVGSEEIFRKIDRKHFESVEFMNKEDVPGYVSGICRKGDLVLIAGAGDIRESGKPILENIRAGSGVKGTGSKSGKNE